MHRRCVWVSGGMEFARPFPLAPCHASYHIAARSTVANNAAGSKLRGKPSGAGLCNLGLALGACGGAVVASSNATQHPLLLNWAAEQRLQADDVAGT